MSIITLPTNTFNMSDEEIAPSDSECTIFDKLTITDKLALILCLGWKVKFFCIGGFKVTLIGLAEGEKFHEGYGRTVELAIADLYDKMEIERCWAEKYHN